MATAKERWMSGVKALMEEQQCSYSQAAIHLGRKNPQLYREYESEMLRIPINFQLSASDGLTAKERWLQAVDRQMQKDNCSYAEAAIRAGRRQPKLYKAYCLANRMPHTE